MSVPLAFGIASIVVMIGFLGNYAAKKFSLPDILILILLGVLLGPVTNLLDRNAFVDIAPLFASLALTLILFDGGLNMRLSKVIEGSARSAALAIISVLSSVAFGALFAPYFLGWSMLEGMLLGAVVGGSSSAVVLTIVKRLNISDKTATILSLESAFTDALVVVLSMTFIQLVISKPNVGIEVIIRGIVGSFSLGAVVGVLFGLLWLRIYEKIEREGYNDILTLAIVLGVYALTETAGGNGGVASLLFGIVLGNSSEIMKMLKGKLTIEPSSMMKRFHGQISFLMKTFFFVYLGIIASFNNYYAFAIGLIFSFLLLFGRFIGSYIVSFREPKLEIDRNVITIMLPRGLAAAVLSQFIATSNIPTANIYTDLVTSVIVATVIISVVGARMAEVRRVKIGIVKKKARNYEDEIKKLEKQLENEGWISMSEEKEEAIKKWLKLQVIKLLIDVYYKEEWKQFPKIITISDDYKINDKVKPTIYLESPTEKIAIEILCPIKGNTKREKIMPIINTAKKYVKAEFDGELKIVLDDISALTMLKELNMIQAHFDRLRTRLVASIWVFNVKERKLLPITSLHELTHIKEKPEGKINMLNRITNYLANKGRY
jgi:cell volume regulation protein A